MKVRSHYVGELDEQTSLRIICIQTSSPFLTRELRPAVGGSVLRWHKEGNVSADELRSQQISTLLSNSSSLQTETGSLNHVLTFPEYSVPQVAHELIDFQTIANERKLIIVPGSYWDADRTSETHCQHLSKIYIPDAPPIVIGKRTPTSLEADWMKPTLDDANIARLWWRQGNGDPIDVSVFLCRDYLSAARGAPEDREDRSSRRLTNARPDFSSEGLNVVLIHASRTQLFEGMARLDLREFRGKRRSALFANSSHPSHENGSTIIVPNASKPNEEITKSLKPEHEGVLSVDSRAWQGSVGLDPQTEDRQSMSDRVIGGHRILSPQQQFFPARLSGDGHGQRAVWRPAFLEAVGLGMVIEFYAVPKDIFNVEDRFTHGPSMARDKVKNVYAGIVRGSHDLCVRRYVRIDAMSDPQSQSFMTECNVATERFLKPRLRDRDKLILPISARNILKYRGRDVQSDTFQDQLAIINRAFGAGQSPAIVEQRNEIIAEVLELADTEACAGVPEKLTPFMFDELEQIVPVRDHPTNRETYVMVSRRSETDEGGAEKKFDEECIKTELMERSSVREIFSIETAPGNHQYLLKLKCTPKEADLVGRIIQAHGERNDLSVNTRTIDFTSHLSASSLSSVNKSIKSAAVVDFLAEIRDRGTEEQKDWANELEHPIGLIKQVIQIAEARAESIPKFKNNIAADDLVFSFYSSLLFYTIEEDPVKKAEYFKLLQDAWSACYKMLENQATKVLSRLFKNGVFGDPANFSKPHEILRANVLNQIKDKDWDKMRSDDMGLFYLIANRLQIKSEAKDNDAPKLRFPSRTNLAKDKDNLRAIREGYRNNITHARPELAPSLDLTQEDWAEKLEGWKQSIVNIFEMLPRIKSLGTLNQKGVLELKRKAKKSEEPA